MRSVRLAIAILVLVVAGTTAVAAPSPAAATSAPVAGPAVATQAASFDPPTATARFGASIAFEQRFRATAQPARVEILLEFPGALGPHVVEVPSPVPVGGALTLRHVLNLGEGHILPNTMVGARWRVTARDGSIELGPRVAVLYADTRFTWRTRTGDRVHVHWYGGSDAFGARALDIGERAVAETGTLLGVAESDPIDFFIYAEQAAFYDALGPGTRENVGGQANAEIRTLFALIGPDSINDPWVGIVIPHELTHLVFDTAVANPYHFPPRWLNEGLAVYLSAGYAAADRREVTDAVRRNALTPLDGLGGQFPTTRDEFFLAYAESVSAVDFLVATYGRDALITLIRSYAAGTTDDEAFLAALGVDVAAFDAAWRSSVGAGAPAVYGPQPAPAGPVPPGWDVPVIVGDVASPRPGTSPGDGPTSPPDSVAGDALPLIPLIGTAAAVAAVLGFVGWRARQRRLHS
ncbi:MAG: peptidase MA family metallohydrolase [Chloroflexota bacterium]